jgi:hypothetical protein
MGLSAAIALFERKSSLRALQRLALTLLVAAEHQRFFGRIQVQSDNVPERDSASAAGYGSGGTASGGGFSSKMRNPIESLATGYVLARVIQPGTTASLIPSFGEDSVGPTSGWRDIFGPWRKPQVELQPPNVHETLLTPFVVLVLSVVLGLGTRKLKTS